MATWHLEILITTDPLQFSPNRWGAGIGASIDFWGVVRALEDEREISGIEYETHQTMAQHQMELIADEAKDEFGLAEVILHHRVGFVATAEASLFLRVASPHREAAYRGSAWIVAELKKRVPIWKKPIFVRQKNSGSSS
ncbi:MAG: molybdenum cofactor biosynthesis protein MoaE [Chthoniobacterales bacterium]